MSVCSGCQQPLKYQWSANTSTMLDLVVVSKMRREYFSNDRKMSRMGNVHFHGNMHCLRSRLSFFHPSLLQLLRMLSFVMHINMPCITTLAWHCLVPHQTELYMVPQATLHLVVLKLNVLNLEGEWHLHKQIRIGRT